MAKTSTHEYTESTVVKVNNPNHLVGNFVTVKLDDEEHCLPEEVAKDLQEQLEKAVVNKTYWYETMQAENDKLRQEIEELKDIILNRGLQEAV